MLWEDLLLLKAKPQPKRRHGPKPLLSFFLLTASYAKLAFWRQQKQSAKARLKEARPPRRSEMRLAREKPVGNALPRHELGKLFDPFLCPLGDNHSYRYTIFLHICTVYMYVVYTYISLCMYYSILFGTLWETFTEYLRLEHWKNERCVYERKSGWDPGMVVSFADRPLRQHRAMCQGLLPHLWLQLWNALQLKGRLRSQELMGKLTVKC